MREPRQRRTLQQVHDEHVAKNHGGERRRSGRPRGTTRERVLDVALELFAERGYDKTSLREIADELGFTKAALYYHFEKKEDILLALHLRMHALGNDAIEKLVQASVEGGGVDAWIGVLDEFIDQVLANRLLFLFHVRNEKALEEIQKTDHNVTDHEDMQDQLRRMLSNAAVPLPIRVRMACAIGAIMAALMGMTDSFGDVPVADLADQVRDAVHDLLAVSEPPRRPRRRAPRSTERHP